MSYKKIVLSIFVFLQVTILFRNNFESNKKFLFFEIQKKSGRFFKVCYFYSKYASTQNTPLLILGLLSTYLFCSPYYTRRLFLPSRVLNKGVHLARFYVLKKGRQAGKSSELIGVSAGRPDHIVHIHFKKLYLSGQS